MSKKNKGRSGEKARKGGLRSLIKDDALRQKVKPWVAAGCWAVGLGAAYFAMASGHPVLAAFSCYLGLSAGVVVYAFM